MFDTMQYDAFQWCVENGITIYCLPAKSTDKLYAVEVNNNGNITTSEKKYKKDEVDTKIWELYCHMYLKYST
jgi:hypothetical protein